MNPTDACVVLSGVGAETTPALRLSVAGERTVPLAPHRRTGTLMTRPASALSASGAPALPVAGTSLLPSTGAAALAAFIPVLPRGRRRRHITVQSGGSAPAFKTCRQRNRAGASVSASIRLGLTPACSGLAALAADARR